MLSTCSCHAYCAARRYCGQERTGADSAIFWALDKSATCSDILFIALHWGDPWCDPVCTLRKAQCCSASEVVWLDFGTQQIYVPSRE